VFWWIPIHGILAAGNAVYAYFIVGVFWKQVLLGEAILAVWPNQNWTGIPCDSSEK
jgi:hypothetical protein